MRHRFALGAAMCLAAALAIGAAPAAAADGCACHTAVPPTDGAPAAHAPLVAGVTDCTVCHKGVTVPHPTMVEPKLTVSGQAVAIGFGIRGGLSLPWLPLAGVVVYVQAKAPAAADYTDIGAPKTDALGFYRQGSFLTEAWTLRAISQGQAGPPVVKPALGVPPFARPTPTLTLRLRGLTHGAMALGGTLTAAGKVTPLEMAGQKVYLKVQRWDAARGKWVWKIRLLKRTINATGAYSWKFTPQRRGLFRVMAKIPQTSAYLTVSTEWRRARVT